MLTLITRHHAWIYNILLRVLYDPHEAEDITQEVLIKIVTKLGSFKGGSRFRTWLYRIAINHALSVKKGRTESMVSYMDASRLARDT